MGRLPRNVPMIALPCVLLLACQHAAAASPMDPAALQRLQQACQAKDWAGAAGILDGLPAQVRLEHIQDLVDALAKAQHWARVLDVLREEAVKPRVKPGSMLFLYQAHAYARTGRHAEALASYREAARKGDLLAGIQASNEAVALGDWKALQEVAEILIALNPTNGQYLGMKGQALAKQGRFREAQEPLEEATALSPKNAMCWADLACCHNELGRYREAYAAADHALQLDPRLLEGLCNRGRAAIGLGNYRKGRDDFQAALQLHPDPALARNLQFNIDLADRYLGYRSRAK